jgi:EKC/KEOPS complex subunit PCC1/LAGE3
VPFPTARLAKTALRAIQVDPELSPLVRRDLSVPDATPDRLQVDYSATTNRMLRVSVNSFMDSLKLVVEVMEHMDEDVILAKATQSTTSE